MNKILVLNMDASPMTVMSFERGFRLAYKGKADVVSHVEDKPIACDISEDDQFGYHSKVSGQWEPGLLDICPTLLSDDGDGFKRPTIVRLNKYVYIPHKKVTLSRYNIYRRDDYSCVYCDSKDNLTIDHVKPKSKGGKNTWENLVTCCKKCNQRKGNRTPEESGIHLIEAPYEPKGLGYRFKSYSQELWKDYLWY